MIRVSRRPLSILLTGSRNHYGFDVAYTRRGRLREISFRKFAKQGAHARNWSWHVTLYDRAKVPAWGVRIYR